MQSVSKKYHNYEYAPGIATYGIDGRMGFDGDNGNCIFYTDYQLNDNTNEETSNLHLLMTAIAQNVMPLNEQSDALSRSYINGDVFLCNNGELYKLIDIDGLKTFISSGQTQASLDDYFVFSGKIQPSQADSSFFETNTAGRLMFNVDYKGLDIFNFTSNDFKRQDFASNDDSDYVLRILSDTTDNKGNINFASFQNVYGVQENAALNFYFDTYLNAFHIQSTYPILIDTDLLVNQEQALKTQFDEYSPVMTKDNCITRFYSECDMLDYDYQAYGIFNNANSTDISLCANYIALDASVLHNYILSDINNVLIHVNDGTKQEYKTISKDVVSKAFDTDETNIMYSDGDNAIASIVKTNPTYNGNIILVRLDNDYRDTSTKLQVSLIKNIEVFLDASTISDYDLEYYYGEITDVTTTNSSICQLAAFNYKSNMAMDTLPSFTRIC